MARMTIKALLVVAAMGGVAAIGCSGGGGGGVVAGDSSSGDNLQVSATDAPVSPSKVAAFDITVSKIWLLSDAKEKITIREDAEGFDLAALRNGLLKDWFLGKFQEGTYVGMGFRIEKLGLTLAGAAASKAVKLAGSADIELPFSEPITVSRGAKRHIVLDFDLGQSLGVFQTSLITEPIITPELFTKTDIFYQEPKLATTLSDYQVKSYDSVEVKSLSLSDSLVKTNLSYPSYSLIDSSILVKDSSLVYPVYTWYAFKPVIRVIDMEKAGALVGFMSSDNKTPLNMSDDSMVIDGQVSVYDQAGKLVASAATQDGYYKIILPEGQYHAIFSNGGYEIVVKDLLIERQKDTEQDVLMLVQ